MPINLPFSPEPWASPLTRFSEARAECAPSRNKRVCPPVRVLHVFKSSYQQSMGGIENALRQMVHASAALGVRNTVLCIGEKTTPADHNANAGWGADAPHSCTVRVVACPATLVHDSLAFSCTMFGRFKTLVQAHDLVHYHFPFPQQDIMHLWFKPAIPSVLTYHSDIVRQRFLYRLYRPLLMPFLSRVDAIVATSANYLASSSVLRRFQDRVRVIPLGLDQVFYPEADPATLQKWETRVGRDFFLFIGVLRYYKGLHILLQAASKTGQRFVIAGAGPMQGSLEEKAKRMGLQNVLFPGFVSETDKAALLRLCRALVFPSHLRSEAFGLTLVEGAMFSRPLISCDIGTGTSFINQHGHTGLVVKGADPDALLGAVETLARNPDMAEIYGQNARNRYLALFTARIQAEKYARLYGRLLGRSL